MLTVRERSCLIGQNDRVPERWRKRRGREGAWEGTRGLAGWGRGEGRDSRYQMKEIGTCFASTAARRRDLELELARLYDWAERAD